MRSRRLIVAPEAQTAMVAISTGVTAAMFAGRLSEQIMLPAAR